MTSARKRNAGVAVVVTLMATVVTVDALSLDGT